ncbi:MAG: putative ABC transporter permease, partial [Clostridiales bacterium]|nr:putative ABC transporter permease [Clostridiales bacterium]
LFWLFFFFFFLGDLIEVVFWLVTRGELTSRSSLLYGPFSIVWGAGAVLLTLAFYRMDDGSSARIFMTGTVLGGAYEYICSWLQEILFGACFWDYRHLPLNLNGRVNLVFCLFWGAAAILWVRLACPALYRCIDRIPPRKGRQMALAAALFLTVSTALSAAALCRMDQRHKAIPAAGSVSQFLDEAYPDSVLHRRYPNMGILTEIGWYGEGGAD